MNKQVTRPDPARLAQIRGNVGRISSHGHAAVAALDGTDVAAAVDAVEGLSDAYTAAADNTVTALLHASLDSRPEVRAAAARTMAVHPYGALQDRLREMGLRDPDAGVREAASKAQDEMHDVHPGCLQCGSDHYDAQSALRLPPSDDPHGAYVFWPVFCSKECAVEYALDRVREDFDGDAIHECLPRGGFERCGQEECDHCAKAEMVGRPLDWDPKAA